MAQTAQDFFNNCIVSIDGVLRGQAMDAGSSNVEKINELVDNIKDNHGDAYLLLSDKNFVAGDNGVGFQSPESMVRAVRLNDTSGSDAPAGSMKHGRFGFGLTKTILQFGWGEGCWIISKTAEAASVLALYIDVPEMLRDPTSDSLTIKASDVRECSFESTEGEALLNVLLKYNEKETAQSAHGTVVWFPSPSLVPWGEDRPYVQPTTEEVTQFAGKVFLSIATTYASTSDPYKTFIHNIEHTNGTRGVHFDEDFKTEIEAEVWYPNSLLVGEAVEGGATAEAAVGEAGALSELAREQLHVSDFEITHEALRAAMDSKEAALPKAPPVLRVVDSLGAQSALPHHTMVGRVSLTILWERSLMAEGNEVRRKLVKTHLCREGPLKDASGLYFRRGGRIVSADPTWGKIGGLPLKQNMDWNPSEKKVDVLLGVVENKGGLEFDKTAACFQNFIRTHSRSHLKKWNYAHIAKKRALQSQSESDALVDNHVILSGSQHTPGAASSSSTAGGGGGGVGRVGGRGLGKRKAKTPTRLDPNEGGGLAGSMHPPRPKRPKRLTASAEAALKKEHSGLLRALKDIMRKAEEDPTKLAEFVKKVKKRKTLEGLDLE